MTTATGPPDGDGTIASVEALGPVGDWRSPPPQDPASNAPASNMTSATTRTEGIDISSPRKVMRTDPSVSPTRAKGGP